MDGSPQLLTNIQFAEAKKGYDRDQVDNDGVDWRGVARAMASNLKAGGVREGASTITMQLARNVWQEQLPQQEKTLHRKLLEVRIAREIETQGVPVVRLYRSDEVIQQLLA